VRGGAKPNSAIDSKDTILRQNPAADAAGYQQYVKPVQRGHVLHP